MGKNVKNSSTPLSRTDIEILNTLQSDCRITVSELSEKVNLSETPCWRRWKKLEKDGYISGYGALLNKKAFDLSVIGFSQIQLESHHLEDTEQFEKEIEQLDWVLMCFCIAGESDYVVQVIARDLEQYYKRVSRLRCIPHVTSINSSIAIKEIKNTHKLPIETV